MLGGKLTCQHLFCFCKWVASVFSIHDHLFQMLPTVSLKPTRTVFELFGNPNLNEAVRQLTDDNFRLIVFDSQ